MSSDYLLDDFVALAQGQPFRLFPFGKLVKGGRAREITKELALLFKLPHFKPPIKLGSHEDTTPAGGHIIGLEVRDDGLYALPEYNEQGIKALEQGSYRYQSPEVIWPGGGIEDPKSGEIINGPLVIGAALLHTPHLGEAAALYTIEMKEVNDMTETVSVPANLWDKFVAWFDRSTATEPPQGEAPQPVEATEQYTALKTERDDLAARLQTFEAEKARKERVDKFAASLSETKVVEGAEMLASMTDEQAAWVLQHFKALSAQIDESNLTGEMGSTGNGAEGAEAFEAAIAAKVAEGVSYAVALRQVAAEKPELAKLALAPSKIKDNE